jgi:uncharacterized protein YeaO (DUF488 family)
MPNIHTKRVYEPADPQDGLRVLVDRVWPRGLTKEQVRADLWLKDAAPSAELRKWFEHDPEKWEEFKQRYFTELDASPEAIRKLVDEAANQPVTLLFSARDLEHNQAVALKEYLTLKIKKPNNRPQDR